VPAGPHQGRSGVDLQLGESEWKKHTHGLELTWAPDSLVGLGSRLDEDNERGTDFLKSPHSMKPIQKIGTYALQLPPQQQHTFARDPPLNNASPFPWLRHGQQLQRTPAEARDRAALLAPDRPEPRVPDHRFIREELRYGRDH
jgi:hypothetical protein